MKALIKFIAVVVLLSVTHICDAQQVRLLSPIDFQVFQRFSANHGTVSISGIYQGSPVEYIEMKVSGVSAFAEWKKIQATIKDSSFNASVVLPAGGWYRIQLRLVKGKKPLTTFVVHHVGVGEVFVVAGQSNAANFGEAKQRVITGKVSTYNGRAWQIAHDPQPLADGTAGSFIPPFADAIVKQFKVPVGIINCAIGATSVREWLPADILFNAPPTIESRVQQKEKSTWHANGEAYGRFVSLLQYAGNHGFRAVLWHQGESDANQQEAAGTLEGSVYRSLLIQLIERSRTEIGWRAPWFVAQASYHVPGDEGSEDIRIAQKAVADSGFALAGPNTDLLKGTLRENNGMGVHFSNAGLKEHAKAWVEKVAPWLNSILPDSSFEKKLPLIGETFSVQGAAAFIILPLKTTGSIPWVWYAPTLPGLPGPEERWMFEAFTKAGIAIAGIDAGESYGSPDGKKIFSALYKELTERHGFSTKPLMLGRSRGGLQTLAWAEDNADKVSGFAGIYPVCDIASYPGIEKASSAYHLSPTELQEQLSRYNPVERLQSLAAANVPLFAIHGDMDVLVPLDLNSGKLKKNYESLGGDMRLIIPPGQGHTMWEGFFQAKEMVDFVLGTLKF